jgi:hypothetical protein
LTCRVADIKLKEHANSTMLAAAEAVGPQLVASLLYKRAAAHKNPKASKLPCLAVLRRIVLCSNLDAGPYKVDW